MTEIPADELQTLTPFPPLSCVLEFGNKKNSTGTYRDWYLANHALTYESIDWNGKDGAHKLDCNYSIALSDITYDVHEDGFDVVTNFGFSEHVSNQRTFWENVHNLTKPGGLMVGVTPAPGHWPHHGILQPTQLFYETLAEANGYFVEKIFCNDMRRRHTICYRFRKTSDVSFQMPYRWEELIIPTEAPTEKALQNSGIVR